MSWASESILREPGVDRHVVQVFHDPGFRTRGVAVWVGEALRLGGGAVLLGSPASLGPIVAKLAESGVDVVGARREGRFLEFDALDMLGRFMVDGEPVGSRFKPLMREAIRSVRDVIPPEAPIRAWGEMVDILCKSGNPAAARRLEALWNECIDEEAIRLLCSYELDHLDPAAHASAFEGACVGHSLLLPEEDVSRLDDAVAAALIEEYGEARAPLMRASLSSGRPFATKMPPSEVILVRLHQNDPAQGARVLRSVKRFLGAGA